VKTGKQYLAGLDDGRSVFIGSEKVANVAEHPAFRNAARTVAAIYDMKAAPENKESMTFEADGERHSMYYLQARSAADLEKRMSIHRGIADMTFGMFGRSPDYFASFVTGMSLVPDLFGPYSRNIQSYFKFMRDRDVFAAHAVVPPQGSRDPAYYQRANKETQACRVVREDDDGLVVSGMKMLATAAVLADELWIGNLIPLAPENATEAVTFAMPCNTPGLSLWSRKPLEPQAKTEFDSPLSWRFDETDSVVLLDRVKVPWERVFVHNSPALAREIYTRTPAHVYGNHQSGVRFLSKLRLIVGLASRIAMATGCRELPAVRETLGRLATMEATLQGMIWGEIHGHEQWPGGFVSFNRRIVYAAMNWCSEQYSGLIDCLRELSGGAVLQMPADVSVLSNPELMDSFEFHWDSAQMPAVDRMKLFRLVWEMVGSEFAGRQIQYEKFYAGPSFIQRGHSYREAPWTEFHGVVDTLLNSYLPGTLAPDKQDSKSCHSNGRVEAEVTTPGVQSD
jgi:4-hydroxyphenylacetate 3-monooxygenase